MGEAKPVTLESIAYWYFRLNGCLTIPNFVVHPDRGKDQETEVDVLAVRFPHRAENLVRPMKDDPVLARDKLRIRLLLAEVKTTQCALNGPWTKRNRQNMQRVLSAVGIIHRDMTDHVAENLYDVGFFQDTQLYISLFCIGSHCSEGLAERYPEVPQITWDHVLAFIFQRFTDYKNQKVGHDQWDEAGKLLWEASDVSRSLDEFRQRVLKSCD